MGPVTSLLQNGQRRSGEISENTLFITQSWQRWPAQPSEAHVRLKAEFAVGYVVKQIGHASSIFGVKGMATRNAWGAKAAQQMLYAATRIAA